MIIRRQRFIIMALLLILVFFSGCQCADPFVPVAEDGVMDLSGWNFSGRSSISLNGRWAFFRNDLISPGKFNGKQPTGYYAVPSYWTSYSKPMPSYGCATYRLIIATDGGDRIYSLRTPEIYTEYALWANGQLLDACGYFAGQQAIYLHPQVYDFYSDSQEMEIVLQVKNDAHVYGGIGQSIRLGTSDSIRKEWGFSAAFDIVLIAIGIFSGLYYLTLYLFRRKSVEQIWFFVLCTAVALRNFLSNTTLIMQVFPNLPFWLGSKLITLTVPVITISILFYTNHLFKHDMPGPAFKILLSVNVLYSAAVLLVPSGIYSALFAYYLMTAGAACIVLEIYVSIRAVINKRKGSIFFIPAVFLLSAGAALDSLNYMQVISIDYVFSAALLGYIVMQAVLLAKRYAEAFRQSELLSNDLQKTLDKLMKTETAYMSAQMKPHFIYNALTTIAEKCETDAAMAGQLIISLSKYMRRTLDYDNLSGTVPLKKELDLVHAYTFIEQARFANIQVIVDMPNPVPPLMLPPLTLQPLVENAIKHGLRKKLEGGYVTVKAQAYEHYMQFVVEDNGVGIPDEVLENLTSRPNGSVSIGLYNIHTRLVRRFGNGLIIKSKNGAGTSISFKIPL